MTEDSSILFHLRPHARVGYGMLLASILLGIIMGFTMSSAYIPRTVMVLSVGILIIGVLTLLFCYFYLQIIVTTHTLSLKRWATTEVINKKDLHVIQFTAKDVKLTISYGIRKLGNFTHKRKEFVTAIKVNSPHLVPFIDSELQKGEKLRLQELKDGLLIAIAVIGLDWPILLVVAFSVALPTWVTIVLLCAPIPGFLAVYWYHQRVANQLQTLPQFIGYQ